MFRGQASAVLSSNRQLEGRLGRENVDDSVAERTWRYVRSFIFRLRTRIVDCSGMVLSERTDHYVWTFHPRAGRSLRLDTC